MFCVATGGPFCATTAAGMDNAALMTMSEGMRINGFMGVPPVSSYTFHRQCVCRSLANQGSWLKMSHGPSLGGVDRGHSATCVVEP